MRSIPKVSGLLVFHFWFACISFPIYLHSISVLQAFYQALTQGQNKQQALMTAQAAVRAQHFKRADGSMQSGTDPYYWAAFVLMDAD